MKMSAGGSANSFIVRVQPRSSRNEVLRNADGSLKVYLTVPPVDNKANTALKRALADEFDVPVSRVTILKGERSKNKVVEIWQKG